MGRIAVTRLMALRMFWNAGYNNEAALLRANAAIEAMTPATAGYYYAEEVVTAIEEMGV
jgi:hypothetical protein